MLGVISPVTPTLTKPSLGLHSVSTSTQGTLSLLDIGHEISGADLRGFRLRQACSAGSRIFVQETIYDEFLERLTRTIKAMKVAQPFQEDAFVGPLTSKLQYDRVSAYIQAGKDEGATVHLGGERHGTEGYFLSPTVFTNCTPEMRICREGSWSPNFPLLLVRKE